MQFSYAVEPISELEQMKDLQEMLLPLFWVEEGVQLGKKYVNLLKYQLFLLVATALLSFRLSN